ncbi:MAG: GntR family transcriptional regulator [Elusimicrobiota bacterium]
MIQIDQSSPVPIYDQIKAGLKGMVAKGLLRPGDQAPSIRALAETLRVNPNTVARAFRELSMEGFLESRRGEGNYISATAQRQAQDGLDAVRLGLRESLRLARRGGLVWPDIESLVRKVKGEEK